MKLFFIKPHYMIASIFILLMTSIVSAHSEDVEFDSLLIPEDKLEWLDEDISQKLKKLLQRVSLVEQDRNLSYVPRSYSNSGMQFDSNVLVDILIQTLDIKAQVYNQWANCKHCHSNDEQMQKLLIYAANDFSKKTQVLLNTKDVKKRKNLLQKLGVYFEGEYLYMKSEKGAYVAGFFVASYSIWTLVTEAAEWMILLHLAPICNISQLVYFMAFRTMLEVADAGKTWFQFSRHLEAFKLSLLWKWAATELRLIYILRRATWNDESISLNKFKREFKISLFSKISYFYKRKINELNDWFFERLPLARHPDLVPYDLSKELSLEVNLILKELISSGLWADLYHHLKNQTQESFKKESDVQKSIEKSLENKDRVYFFRALKELSAAINVFRIYLKELIRIKYLEGKLDKEEFRILISNLGEIMKDISDKRKWFKLEILNGSSQYETLSRTFTADLVLTKNRLANLFDRASAQLTCNMLFL